MGVRVALGRAVYGALVVLGLSCKMTSSYLFQSQVSTSIKENRLRPPNITYGIPSFIILVRVFRCTRKCLQTMSALTISAVFLYSTALSVVVDIRT